jgi:hypothetical protein
MMFLAESHNTGDPTPYLQAEAARMSELQQAGIVEMVLFKAVTTTPRTSSSSRAPSRC